MDAGFDVVKQCAVFTDDHYLKMYVRTYVRTVSKKLVAAVQNAHASNWNKVYWFSAELTEGYTE